MTKKISELPAAGSAVGTDEFEVNQGGVSKKETNSQMMAFYKANMFDQDLDTTDNVTFNQITATQFIRLQETGAGTDKIIVQAPGSIISPFTLTLPSTQAPTSQSILYGDVTGQLSWSDNPGDFVVGPASSTDNALARFDSTTGKLVKNSNATLDDTGNMVVVGDVKIGDSTTDIDRLLHLQSRRDANLWLEADTQNNVSEGMHPFIYFTQDLNNTMCRMGYSDDNHFTFDFTGSSSGNNIEFTTQGTLTGGGTAGVLPTITPGTVALTLNASSNRVEANVELRTPEIDTITAGQLAIGNSVATSVAIAPNTIIGGTSLNASAVLQIDSTTKGFLPPRMTTTQRNNIATPATGLEVYDTSLNKWYGYNGSAWVPNDGDVVGPASSLDNALVRFDGTTGKLIQNSSVTLDDLGNMIVDGDVTVETIDKTTAGQLVIGATTATSVSIDPPTVIGSTSIDSSAALQVVSTTQGFIPPRMTTAQRTAISSPLPGLMVYDTQVDQLFMWSGIDWSILG